jgi:K+-sensing histidine kinase KdpD
MSEAEVMPAPESQQQGVETISHISSALSSFWAWLIPMVAGILHIGKLQQKITQIETDHVDMKQLVHRTETHLAKLSAHVETLMNDRNHNR